MPYPTMFPAKEIRYITRDTKPEFTVFGHHDWVHKVEKIQEGNSGKMVKSLIGLNVPKPGVKATGKPIQLDESVKPLDQALIIYTSGTTNLPVSRVSFGSGDIVANIFTERCGFSSPNYSRPSFWTP